MGHEVNDCYLDPFVIILSTVGALRSQGRCGNAGDRSDVLSRVLHPAAIDAINTRKTVTQAAFM